MKRLLTLSLVLLVGLVALDGCAKKAPPAVEPAPAPPAVAPAVAPAIEPAAEPIPVAAPPAVAAPAKAPAYKKSTVKEVQEALKARGLYNGPVDGVLSPETMTAIEAFQKAEGLKADGIPGPTTRAKLLGAAKKTEAEPAAAPAPEAEPAAPAAPEAPAATPAAPAEPAAPAKP